MNFKPLHNIWLYYIDKKNWDGIINIYKSLYDIDYEIYYDFKRFIDCSSSSCIDNANLLELLPFKYKKKLLQLFNKSKKIQKIHIICDMDDTIVKNYNLPGHDYSYNNNTYYPYILDYMQNFVYSNNNSSRFITICSMRPTHLSEYSKSKIKFWFHDNIHTQMTTPFFFLYHSFITLLNIWCKPFTHEWFEKYKIAGYLKYEKIKMFSKIYPELDICFIGDTGEGDLITAILMLLNKNINTKYIFLHDIKNQNNESYIQENQQLNLFNNRMHVIKKNKKLEISYKNHYYYISLFDNYKLNDIQCMFHIMSLNN